MALVIHQDENYLGKERWEWSLWVDGPTEELDFIDHVVYRLDSTFHDPVRTISERSTNFRLSTSGWGTFKIYAKAVMKDGPEIPLEHDLVLRYPSGTATLA